VFTSLSIKNYALIDDIHVDFGPGLTIITGETGAGKSILLGALSLILGKRADLSSVKDTSKKCIVEAVFNIENYILNTFFLDNALDYDSETIVRREILPSGKSRAFINDSPVNLDVLTKMGKMLIDVHSQHQNLDLTSNQFQFQVIDALANNQDKIQSYKSKLQKFQLLKKEVSNLNLQKAEAIKEQDYNTFLLNELVEANLVSGELKDLEAEQETLSNVEEIQSTLQESFQLLDGEQLGVLATLNELKQRFKNLSDLSSAYLDVYNRITSLIIELEDVYSEVESAKDNLEADPQKLQTINEKLSVLQNLMLKHSVSTIDELLVKQEDLSNKVILFETIDDQILEIENKLVDHESKLNNLALDISKNRVKTIPLLTQKLHSILIDLGMEFAQFDINLEESEDFLINGKDKLNFLFSANKGIDPKDLKHAVSGGELSRIMLAIKSVLTQYEQLPTIIFDEIDTGVSGEISNKMALIMQEMSLKMQVLAITHLPQIAAKGDSHFKVFKETTKLKTVTHLMKLNKEDRVLEIAEMLGGKETSTSAIAHAKQLLN